MGILFTIKNRFDISSCRNSAIRYRKTNPTLTVAEILLFNIEKPPRPTGTPPKEGNLLCRLLVGLFAIQK